MRPRTTIVLAIAALLAASCAGAHPDHIVLGPYDTLRTAAFWERTLAAVREAHYEPVQVDASRGQIIVASRIYGTREQILIQLYREGWVQVGIVQQTAGYWGRPSIPPDLADEEVELSLALRERLEHGPAPARDGGVVDDEVPGP